MKYSIQILIALILAIGGLSWFIIKTSAVTTPTIFFEPETSALVNTQTISLKINSGANQIGFIRVSFAFDKNKINLGEILQTNPFDTVIEKTGVVDANNLGAARLVVAVPPAKAGEAPSGEFEIARIPIHVLSTTPNDATVFIFNKEDIQIIDMQNNPVPFDIVNPAYTLNVVEATQTPTNTPVETTITSTPTPLVRNTNRYRHRFSSFFHR